MEFWLYLKFLSGRINQPKSIAKRSNRLALLPHPTLVS
jgi:hypothetical protein